jgi:hypothetical protein
VRWKKGPEIAAFGGGSTSSKDDRKVKLEARDASGTLVACAVVTFKDLGGQSFGSFGTAAVINDWKRRGTPC